jgi:hypothetical protein
MDDGFAHVEVLGFEGLTYQVEGSTDLQHWQPVATNVPSGHTLVLPRTNIPGADARFYRGVIEHR